MVKQERKRYLENITSSALYNHLMDTEDHEAIFKEVFKECSTRDELRIVGAQIRSMALLVKGDMHK